MLDRITFIMKKMALIELKETQGVDKIAIVGKAPNVQCGETSFFPAWTIHQNTENNFPLKSLKVNYLHRHMASESTLQVD